VATEVGGARTESSNGEERQVYRKSQARRIFKGGSKQEKRGVVVCLPVNIGGRRRKKGTMPQLPVRASTGTQAAAKRGRSLRALAAAILAGGAVATVLFVPSVTVEAEGPVDPSSPYPISFSIANASIIPLTNVNAYLVICYAVAAPAPTAPACQPPFRTRLFKASWRDHSLSANQHFSITLDDALPRQRNSESLTYQLLLSMSRGVSWFGKKRNLNSQRSFGLMESWIGSRARL
jgi:hypothetical protein